MAFVARIGKGGRGRPRRTTDQGGGSSGGNPSGEFQDRPRIILTPLKIAELQGYLATPTAEATALINFVNVATSIPNTTKTTLAEDLGLSGVGETFAVADGSAFPSSGEFQVRIDLEVLTVTRSLNTFTVVSRGNFFQPQWGTGAPAVGHVSGTTVWRHSPNGDFIHCAPAYALLYKLGYTGMASATLEARTIAAISQLAAFQYGRYQDGNGIRWYAWPFACAYDWGYDLLSTREKEVCAEVANITINHHGIIRPKDEDQGFGVGNWSNRQRQKEMIIGNNVAGGQLRSSLALAAVSDGDNPNAFDQWEHCLNKVISYLKPGHLTGTMMDGLHADGTAYLQTDWIQWPTTYEVLHSAIDSSVFEDVTEYFERNAEMVFYLTQDGSKTTASKTTGTVTSGANTIAAVNASGFAVGDEVGIAIPMYPGSFYTQVAGVSGNTITVGGPPFHFTGSVTIEHRRALLALGDTQAEYNFSDQHISGELPIAMYLFQHLVHDSNPTLAGQIQWWLENKCIPASSVPGYLKWEIFLAKKPGIAAIDYTATLPINKVVGSAEGAYGLLLGRSSWDKAGTKVFAIGGSWYYDHSTCYHGSFGIKRKGTYLTRHLTGYGSTGFTSADVPFGNYPRQGVWQEQPYMSAPYHNSIWMNGHSGLWAGYDPSLSGDLSTFVGNGPATTPLKASSSAYAYAQFDLSYMYQMGRGWPAYGFANDYSETFIRDFLYINPDLVVYHDRVGYSNATLSPTTWFTIHVGDPTIAGSRVTSTVAGQKLVEDVVLPASAVIVEKNLRAEEHATQLEGYRVSTTSGVTSALEYGLHVFQAMDSGDTPETVTLLTTTNMDAASIGTDYVVGFVKTATPTFPMSYTYSGSPAHYLMGFAASTAYHITDSGTVITVDHATGTDDTTSNSGGMLIF